MMHRRKTTFVFAFVSVVCASICLNANTILDPSAPSTLALYNLGTAPDIAASYTNQVFYEGLAITGNNLLLSVGDPATATQKVWSLPLVRINNHISGFGAATVYDPVLSYPGTCCLGNIVAGGLVPVGNDLLYTTTYFSYLGQHTGGNPGASNLIDLASTGAAAGGLNYVPGSFTNNGGGQLKMSSTCSPGDFGCNAQGDWYTLNLGGSVGNYSLNSFTAYTVGVAALSFDYVPVDATFTHPGIVLGDSSQLRLDYYQVDGNGNPCNPTMNISCGPVIHMVVSDTLIGLGVVRDPVTGDILFTSGDNQIYMVTDSAPEPGTITLAVAGLLLTALKQTRATRSQ
jgi:hypothetical protein